MSSIKIYLCGICGEECLAPSIIEIVPFCGVIACFECHYKLTKNYGEMVMEILFPNINTAKTGISEQ